MRLKEADEQGRNCNLKKLKSVPLILRVKGNKLIYKTFDNRKTRNIAPLSAGIKTKNKCGGGVKIIDY